MAKRLKQKFSENNLTVLLKNAREFGREKLRDSSFANSKRGSNMKLINNLASRFGVSLNLNEKFIVKKKNQYFLLNKELKKLAKGDFFYAGVYLGKVKNGKFFPSFNLLRMIAEGEANKVIVNEKTAWLFICGRDIFKCGIVKAAGLGRKGDYVLVLNQNGECLGFGKILINLNEAERGVVIKNILDLGDFLRRERQQV